MDKAPRKDEGLNRFVGGSKLKDVNDQNDGSLTVTAPSDRNAPFKAPSWAALPRARPGNSFYVETWKEDQLVARLNITDRKMTLVGRHGEMAQIVTQHISISRQHAAILYHPDRKAYFVVDLKSFHGTFVNGKQLVAWEPRKVDSKDEITFGGSSRIYIIRELESGKEKVEEAEAPPPPKKLKIDDKLEQVHCSHILVKHAGSRRPLSWRQTGPIKRTKEEAISLINHYIVQLTSGAVKFDELAKKYSDCSSAMKGGDLGTFKRGQMQPPFEQAS